MASITVVETRPTGTIADGSAYFESSTNKFIVYDATNASWLAFASDGVGAYGGPFIKYTINSSGGDFAIRAAGAVNYDVNWGDGNSESSTAADLTHTYAAAGSYTIKIASTEVYRPSFVGHTADATMITSVEVDDGISLGDNLYEAFMGLSNMTDFTASSATSLATQYFRTWKNCTNLTNFSEIDSSKGTNFRQCWMSCPSLTSFPALDFSSAIGLTAFNYCWFGCTNLSDFPANVFDNIGALGIYGFTAAFKNCALTPQSIENILTSIDTNGASDVQLGIDGGSNAGYSSWSDAAKSALTSLTNKGWTVTYNA